MKKKFDIKYRPQIESGLYKVVTALGERVEILDWDCDPNNIDGLPIVGKIWRRKACFVEYYNEEGCCEKNPKENNLYVVGIDHEPKFKEGDEIISIRNQRIKYRILHVGIPNELGNLDYECEYLGEEDEWVKKGVHRLMEIEKVDSWGKLINERPELTKFKKTLLPFMTDLIYKGSFGNPTERELLELAEKIERELRFAFEEDLPTWKRFSNDFCRTPALVVGDNLECGNHYIPLAELKRLPSED